MTDSLPDERPAKRVKTLPGADFLAPNSDSPAKLESLNGSRGKQKVDDLASVLQKEQQVGISPLINDGRPIFRGTLKKRYTDFQVNEIDPGGKVVHLTNLRVGVNAQSYMGQTERSSLGKEQQHQNEDNTNTLSSGSTPSALTSGNVHSHNVSRQQEAPVGEHTESSIAPEDRVKLVEHLNETAVSELLELYDSVLNNPGRKQHGYPIVRSAFTSDRMVRAQIHQDIRRIFESRIDSSTDKDGTLILSAANSRSRNSKQNRIGKLSWIERGGEHCHFSLYKENKDTMESISFLAHLLRKNARDFQIAGTKDRRAATTQRVSGWRIEAERLKELNNNSAVRSAALGNFEYQPSGLQLGDLSGNEFVLTVRDCRLEGADGEIISSLTEIQESLSETLSELRTKGFLNYYGLQRFGTFAIRSDVIGLRILKGDFRGACDLILDYNSKVLENGVDASKLDKVGRDDFDRAKAIKIFRDTNSIKDSLATMPKRFTAESNIIRTLARDKDDCLRALMAIQRNMRNMYVHAYQSRVWNTAVTSRWHFYGDRVVEGDLVLVNEHKDKESTSAQPETVDADGEVVIHASGEDRAAQADELYERARALTAEEAASGQYSIFDVVLPLPGYDVEYPQNESGQFYKKFMNSEEGGSLDPHDMRRPQRDFSLSGSYRKMVARIGMEYDVAVHKYSHDEEQFVMTDLQKIRGGKNHLKADGEVTEEGQNEVEVAEQSDSKIAVVLKFQLGTSQYATMALRELSRRGVVEYKPEFSGGR